MKSVLLVLTSTYLASCLPPPHPAVVQVRREEEQLHPHLRSKALWNPHLQEILPLASLLHEGETPVFDREADKVSRQEIYNILTHAGFLPRRHPQHQPDPNHRQHERTKSAHNHAHQGHHQAHHSPQQFSSYQTQFPGHQFQQTGPFGHQSFNQGFFAHSPFLGNPELLQYL